VRLTGQLTLRDLFQLGGVGVLGPVEVFKDDDLLNGSQLTKKLADDSADVGAPQLLQLG